MIIRNWRVYKLNKRDSGVAQTLEFQPLGLTITLILTFSAIECCLSSTKNVYSLCCLQNNLQGRLHMPRAGEPFYGPGRDTFLIAGSVQVSLRQTAGEARFPPFLSIPALKNS